MAGAAKLLQRLPALLGKGRARHRGVLHRPLRAGTGRASEARRRAQASCEAVVAKVTANVRTMKSGLMETLAYELAAGCQNSTVIGPTDSRVQLPAADVWRLLISAIAFAMRRGFDCSMNLT
jgi:hypothetical protein